MEQTNGGTTSIQFGREWIKREDGIGSNDVCLWLFVDFHDGLTDL
jgi:hypothetical protein